jgi:hypothetical protein
MSRLHQVALVATLPLMLASPAHADEAQWPLGIASIPILSATPSIHIAVENVSASTSPLHRKLANVSPPPAYSLSGQVFCKAILGGTTRLVESQVMFGTPTIWSTNVSTQIFKIGVWDETAPIQYEGNISSANVQFQHALDVPETWNGGLVTLGFNPVKVVEDHLASYVASGGSAADFLRHDQVFEVPVAVNLVGVCKNTSSLGVHTFAGLTRRWITAFVLYKGDPRIQDFTVTIPGLPGGITQTPSLPPSFDLNAPVAPQEPGDGREPDDGHFLVFDRFPIYDLEAGRYDGHWSGWVTYSDEYCPEESQRAVSPSRECVFVEACMPAEFLSCRELDGCCDAPAPDAERESAR